MPYLSTSDGTSLYYKDWGHGVPVVLVHGLFLHSGMWENQLQGLSAAGMRVVCYDRRGHGRSDTPNSGYHFDGLADDLNAVLTALRLKGAVLVAHSMGSGEITRYLTRHGTDRVSAVAYIAGTTPCLHQRPEDSQGLPLAKINQLMKDFTDDRAAYFARLTKPYFNPHGEPTPALRLVIDETLRMCMHTPLEVSTECFRNMLYADFSDELARLPVPALVVHGSDDASAVRSLTGDRTAELIPNVRYRVYDGAGHGLYHTHRDRLNRDLVEFIQEVLSQPGSRLSC